MAAILLIDPFAPLGAGLWFSFLAVAALIWVFRPRTGRLPWWKTALIGQVGVIMAILAVRAILARFAPDAEAPALKLATYAIGITASYWLIDRIIA